MTRWRSHPQTGATWRRGASRCQCLTVLAPNSFPYGPTNVPCEPCTWCKYFPQKRKTSLPCLLLSGFSLGKNYWFDGKSARTRQDGDFTFLCGSCLLSSRYLALSTGRPSKIPPGTAEKMRTILKCQDVGALHELLVQAGTLEIVPPEDGGYKFNRESYEEMWHSRCLVWCRTGNIVRCSCFMWCMRGHCVHQHLDTVFIFEPLLGKHSFLEFCFMLGYHLDWISVRLIFCAVSICPSVLLHETQSAIMFLLVKVRKTNRHI